MRSTMRWGSFLVALTLLRIAAPAAAAQVPLSPRSLGMGGAMIAAARGQDAVFLNPANLALPGTPRWSISLIGAAAGAELVGIDAGDFVDLIQFDDLDGVERNDLFEKIPDEGIQGDVALRSPLLGWQLGSFGLGLSYVTLGGHGISRDLVELMLYGYEEGRTDYDVADTRGDRAALWDAALAYGTASGPLSLGVTTHLLFGGTQVRTFMTDPRIDLAARDIDVDYLGVRTTGGRGISFDFGAAYQLRPELSLSGVITGAYSWLDWDRVRRVRELTLSRQDFDNPDGLVTDLLRRYGDSERDLTPQDEARIPGDAARLLRADAQLPTTATLGAAWQPLARTDIVASYSQDIITGRLSGGWERRGALGAEHRLARLLAVRAGVATNLASEMLVSAGLSLGPINLGLAKTSGSRDGVDREGWIGVFGLSMQVDDSGSPRP